jgi:hypothetical protein
VKDLAKGNADEGEDRYWVKDVGRACTTGAIIGLMRVGSNGTSECIRSWMSDARGGCRHLPGRELVTPRIRKPLETRLP